MHDELEKAKEKNKSEKNEQEQKKQEKKVAIQPEESKVLNKDD